MRQDSVEFINNRSTQFLVDELSFEGKNLSIIFIDSEINYREDCGGKSQKKLAGRKRRTRNELNQGISKKHIKEMNKKYIQEAKRKSVFPPNFIYAKFIKIIK